MQLLVRIAIFLVSLFVCTVWCVLFWDWFVAEKIYHCTDAVGLEFLQPGDWCHLAQGDTLRPGWSIAGLWALWIALASGSLVASGLISIYLWHPDK